MAEAFLHFGGGGSSESLNFTVIGGTSQPATASENTIWVNTDATITGYTISATAPEEPTDGMVWITPGASGEAVVTVTKKNPIKVYPISAKQYVSGAWVDVTAKNWQDGAWVDWWSGELYEPGNVYETYTGGWQLGETTTGTVDVTDTGIVLETPGQVPRVHVETIQKVEFGDYKKIEATVEVISCPTGSHLVRLGYSTAPKTSLANATTKNEKEPGKNFTGEFKIDLDISSAPSSAYVVVGAGFAGMKFIVKKVQMIK